MTRVIHIKKYIVTTVVTEGLFNAYDLRPRSFKSIKEAEDFIINSKKGTVVCKRDKLGFTTYENKEKKEQYTIWYDPVI